MVRLLRPETFFSAADAARDLTPDSPGPAFNLPNQPDWRSHVESYLDGRPHTYRLEMRWQQVNGVGEIYDGPKEEIRFVSKASTWDEWKREYYDAVREFIAVQRRRNAVRRTLSEGGLKKKRGVK